MNDAANCMHRQFTESQSYCPDCGLSRSEVLVAACEPYLKDEETPAECIARNRRDVDGCLTMLVAEKRKTEALQARLAEAEQFLREFIALNLLHDERDRAAVRRFLSKADSASVCEACGGTGKAYLLHSRAERPCPMCQPDQPPGVKP